MQLTYRGITYNAQPSAPAYRPANISGKYRGVPFTFSDNQAATPHPQTLSYRGSKYHKMIQHSHPAPNPCSTFPIDLQEILEYGLRSQLVYGLSRSEWKITAHLGWRLLDQSRIFFPEAPRSRVNTLVEVDDRRQIQWLAVRGSQNLRNWMLNLRYMQRPFTKNFQNRRVLVDLHWGFYEAAEEVYQAILPYIRRDYPIRLTGHSLGGAITVLLLMFLKEDGYEIDRCVTFGQPKVTDQRGAEQCQHLPLLRVVNHQDVVPMLPPATLLTQLQGNYAHFGQELYLQPDRGYSDSCPHRPMQSFWLGLLQTLGCPQLSRQKIQDHDLSLYLLALLDNLEAPTAPNFADLKQALSPALENLMPSLALAQ